MRSLYRALLISMLSGRVVFGVVQTVILGLANKAFGFGAFIASAFFEAIPGIILQLIIIPAIMLALDKTHLMPPRSKKREGQTCLSPAVAIDELSEIIERIAEKKGRAVVAIDGRCSAGKTTLAEALADRLGAAVFHLDDFFLPESLREEGYIESTGANADIERFLSEVLLPLSRGESVFYSPFCCKTGEYLTRVEVKPEKIVIVEGSYSCHPQLSPYYDLSIFVYISEELQLARLKARDEAKLPAFKNRWIPMEEAYFERFGIKESCKILISHEQP